MKLCRTPAPAVRSIAIGLAAIAIFSSSPLCSAEPATDAIDRYLREQTLQLSEQSRKDLAAVDATNWPETQRRWRAELREMLGIDAIGEAGDLRTEVTDTFTIPGVRVRNLHYQSLPGLYVTANLYLPDTDPPEGGWPAVLYVCGHSRQEFDGRLYGNKAGYHHHGLWFARHGVACLTIDTVQLGELHGEHHGTNRLGRWDWFSRGYTPAGVEAINAIRGVDLLCSLPEIDASKIGMTGRSGGGAYTWFAAALDDRIKAAVPVAGITDLQDHVVGGCVEGHCDCMYFVNYHRWDYGKLAALVAPRPLLLANSDNDGIFPLGGVLRIHEQLKDLYGRLGEQENFRLLITPGSHADTQELQVGAFRWLLDHLKGSGTVVDLPANKELEASQLRVFGEKTPADERVTSVSGWLVPAAEPAGSPEEAAEAWTAEWSKRLSAAKLTERSLPAARGWKERIDAEPRRLLNEGTTDGFRWRRYEVASGLGYSIGVFEVRKTQTQGAPDLLCVPVSQAEWELLDLPSTNRAKTFNPSRFEAWLDGGDRAVAFVASLGVGPTHSPVAPKAQTHRLRSFSLLGQTLDAVHVGDLLSTAAYFEREGGFETIGFGGTGRSAVTAALAALQTDPPRRLSIDDPATSPPLAPAILGLLRVCSYVDLVSAAEHLCDNGETPTSAKDGEQGRAAAVDPLLAPATGPWQATGVRFLNVGQSAASVLTRTTRDPLPNLADLPEIELNGDFTQGNDGGVRHAVPGMQGRVRVRYRAAGGAWQMTPWLSTSKSDDYFKQFELADLRPGTRYEVRVEAGPIGSGDDLTSTLSGGFKTLPAADTQADFRIAVFGPQTFEERDGPFGFEAYRTIQAGGIDAVVFACGCGMETLATDKDFYRWQRLAGLPTSIDLFKDVPAYFSGAGCRPWSGNDRSGLLEDRTYRVGKDLQLWLMGPADARPTSGDKPYAERLAWLRQSLAESDASHRVVIAAVANVAASASGGTPRGGSTDAEATLAAGILQAIEGDGRATAIFCGGSQPPHSANAEESDVFALSEPLEITLEHRQNQAQLSVRPLKGPPR